MRIPRNKAYAQLWKVVDGAIADALSQHPDYLTEKGQTPQARASITKRVVGTVLSYAEQSAKGRRTAAEKPAGVSVTRQDWPGSLPARWRAIRDSVARHFRTISKRRDSA